MENYFTSEAESPNTAEGEVNRTAAEWRVYDLENAIKEEGQQASRMPEAVEENPAEFNYTVLEIAAVFLLVVALGLRRIAKVLNVWSDPWALSPAEAANYTEKIRAEEEAFAEFIRAFNANPYLNFKHPRFALIPTSASNPVAEFHAEAPELVGRMRKLLQEILKATRNSAQRQLLEDLQRELHAFKGKSGLPELLPVWQLATALEGLIKQLVDLAGNVTASTLRTVGSSIDLFEALCQPDLKSDLLSNPPLRFLAVDDDIISRKAVALALKKAFNPPDLAPDGEAALALAEKNAYDVIFLDVQMPGLDGYEVCTQIHQTVPNRLTPVVFVTCMSDFDARAKSVLSGGVDLIGKPFLTFEITVQALTLALRGRLQGRAYAAGNKAERKTPATFSPSAAEKAKPARTSPSPVPARPSVSLPSGKTTDPNKLDEQQESLPDDPVHAFLSRAATQLARLQDLIQSAFQATDELVRAENITNFYLQLHALAPEADAASTHPALRMSAVLEGLLKKLLENPKNCTSSTLLTIATAVDLLSDLCTAGINSDLATNPPIRMLVVDDDPVCRRAMSCALQMAFEKPEDAEDGKAALASASERTFDLIFLDVQMPDMDGFSVCSRIHETVPNRSTPVVFVTSHSDFKTRTQSTLSGGGDLIGKPFLPAEIAVKALTFAMRGRLHKLKKRNLIAQSNGLGGEVEQVEEDWQQDCLN